MNKARRTALQELISRIESICDSIADIEYDEQSALDNTPENLQGTERYELMEEAVSAMQEAEDLLSSAAEKLSELV